MAFRRVAVVNRGEAAMRLIRAATELRLEGQDLTTIAFCTESERNTLFAREADEQEIISTADGIAYLDYAELERALLSCRADAAWVGWGFVAEHPQFADLCDRLGITFIGPPGDVSRLLGDKIEAKRLAESVGAPVAAWSGGPVASIAEAEQAAAAIGFPLLVKATAGGGGRGIRSANSPEEVGAAFERATSEAERSFGDPTVFLERRLTGAHHIEVQIAADDGGTVWALGVRDCSVQRRNQKLIEESSSPVLDDGQRQHIAAIAVELARAARYRSLGTVEFLYAPDDKEFAFLEVNTRLQVEHPVTEATTGLDLVKLQLQLASGARLEGDPPPPFGHAIEARLNAEDPQRGFSPAPGLIEHLEFASGTGMRVDTGVAVGDTIPSDYDAMVAKVIAWGRSRDEARARLIQALRGTTVVIQGGTTNKAFLTDILARQTFVDGIADIGWIDRLTDSGELTDPTHLDLALVVAAIDGWNDDTIRQQRSLFHWAARGRPQTTNGSSQVVECAVNGQRYEIEVGQTSPHRFLLTLDGHSLDVGLERYGSIGATLHIRGRTHRVRSTVDGTDHLVEIDGTFHRISRGAAGLVRAPAPALVVSMAVKPGDVLAEGDPVAVLESMKMETTLTTPISGTVREVYAWASSQVDAGSPLLRLDQDDTVEPRSATGRVQFDEEVRSTTMPEVLDAMRWLILGFAAGDEQELIDTYTTERAAAGSDEILIGRELAVLDTFAGLCALSRNRPEAEASDDELHSPELYFHRYLRSLDVEAEGLPVSFRNNLATALGLLGVNDLERSAELEVAAHQLFLALTDISGRRPMVMAVLGQLPAALIDASDDLLERVRSTLDHLIETTQVRHASVGDQARSIRFRVFDEPTIERTRQRVMTLMQTQLDAMGGGEGNHRARVDELARCPYPVVGLLADHLPGASFEPYTPLLEVLTTRNYRIRHIEAITRSATTTTPTLTVRYRRPHDDEQFQAVATLADASDLRSALESVAAVATDFDDTRRVLADVYVSLDEAAHDAAGLADWASEALAETSLPAPIERIAFSAAERDGRSAAVTFRRTDPTNPMSWREDEPLRGIHPMMAVRLGLWRWSPNFDLQPVPSPTGAHVFKAIAYDDPGDERIFAAAEVRDLAAVHADSGRLIGLPGLEQAYTACIDGLRRAQVERPDRRRLLWNRIFLYVWEPVDFDLSDAASLVAELEPLGRGLGIEEVIIQANLRQPDGTYREHIVRVVPQPGQRAELELANLPTTPLRPISDYERKVVMCRQGGTVYPYELLAAIRGPRGDFAEHDIDAEHVLVPVDRAPGLNTAGIVAGIVTTPTDRYPEGIRRVVLLGDPTKSLGSLAEAECRLVIAALDCAEEEEIPVEWFSLSSGARVAMDSGTENMDWVAAALRRIVRFTQAGGEINVVVTGINVGAQPYWNAEATMLQHTKGILVMTPDSAMVLTGKQALDISGGVSAEDNFGIGGYDRIMGPNGQAQYWAPDLAGACRVLFAHYDHAYRAPGEDFPRRAKTGDPLDRDVRPFPHEVEGCDFVQVGDIFSDTTNPGRKKPFDIRTLMRSVVDQDAKPPLERWAAMRDAENAVVFDAKLGGLAVTLVGVESRSVGRHGAIPADGPDQWMAGTLFPKSSKKVARAINAASGNRPIVFLANLSGFDGSPESLRELQLEYGAEIGRAIVNFDGPIVFCVVSRYHGGAFVVFSGALNDNMEVLAVEGTHASVLGGAAAAAVVFAGEIRKRVANDPRIMPDDDSLTELVRLEKLGELAAEFDAVHSIERAKKVGSVNRIISAAELRPELIAAVERGMDRFVRARSPS